MMNLRNLMDLLPYYFKENDTYKNSAGKGILEQFLEICGGYLEDQVTPDIESLLENLDVMNCPEYFLNYFWEWFGCIPYANAPFIDPDKWAQYYNGYNPNANKDKWVFPERDPFNMSLDTKRRIIRYAITLLKCRGSRVFFETMFRFYGVECDITDGASELSEEIPVKTPVMDDELNLSDGNLTFDEVYDCKQCIPVYFVVTYKGNYQNGDETDEDSDFYQFKQAVTNFINKYIPFNAHPMISFIYDGQEIFNQTYYIRVTNLTTGESQYADTYNPNTSPWVWTMYQNFQLNFRVEVWSTIDPKGSNSTWRYILNEDRVNPYGPYPSGTIVIKGQELGQFRYSIENVQAREASTDSGRNFNEAINLDINVVIKPITEYDLNIGVVSSNGEITYNGDPIEVFKIGEAYLKVYPQKIETSQDGSQTTYPSLSVSPSDKCTVSELNGNYYEVRFIEPGTYRIAIAENNTVYRDVTINLKYRKYKVVAYKNNTGVNYPEGVSSVAIPADQSSVGVYLVVEPQDKSLSFGDYKGDLISSEIQWIGGNLNYTINEVTIGNPVYSDGVLVDSGKRIGVLIDFSLRGTYQFRSLLNTSLDLVNEDLWATLKITKESKYSGAMIISPETLNINLSADNDLRDSNGTLVISDPVILDPITGEPDNAAITIRYDLKINYYDASGNTWYFQQNPNNSEVNGYYTVTVFKVDDSGQMVQLSDSEQVAWLGYNSSEHHSNIGGRGTDATEFSLTIPRTNKPEGNRYIQITYRVPNDFASLLVNYEPELQALINVTDQNNTPILSGDYISIYPYNSSDSNWKSPSPSEWNKYYPSTDEYISEATYQKSNEDNTCKFGLYVKNFSSPYRYTLYNYPYTEGDSPIEEGNLTESNGYLTATKVGVYVFDCGVTLNFRDLIPDIILNCNPTSVLMDSEYSQVSTVVTLSMNPDSSKYSHRVQVLKDEDSSFSETLDLTNPVTYSVTSPGTYRFRSIEDPSKEAVFNAYTKNSLIGKITCDPNSASITDEVTQVSTTVRMFDKNGTELVDTSFLIRFPDGSTALSGTIFTTNSPGVYTFSAYNNPNISGEFVVSDGTSKPAQFGCIRVINDTQEVTFPYPTSGGVVAVSFTGWAKGDNWPTNKFEIPYTTLTANDITVQYMYSGGAGWVTIPYNGSSIGYSLFSDADQAAHQYHINVYGISFTGPVDIRIRPTNDLTLDSGSDTLHLVTQVVHNYSYALYWTGGQPSSTTQPTPYPTVPCESPIMWLALLDNGVIQDWDTMFYYSGGDVWEYIHVYLDGKDLLSVSEGSSGELTEGYYKMNADVTGENGSARLLIWQTAATHQIYVRDTYNNKQSNTLTILGNVIIDMDSVTYLMYRNTQSDSWSVEPQTNTFTASSIIGSYNYTQEVQLCPGYNGQDEGGTSHSMEEVLDLNYALTSQSNVVTEIKVGDNWQTLNLNQSLQGINTFRFRLIRSEAGNVQFTIQK